MDAQPRRGESPSTGNFIFSAGGKAPMGLPLSCLEGNSLKRVSPGKPLHEQEGKSLMGSKGSSPGIWRRGGGKSGRVGCVLKWLMVVLVVVVVATVGYLLVTQQKRLNYLEEKVSMLEEMRTEEWSGLRIKRAHGGSRRQGFQSFHLVPSDEYTEETFRVFHGNIRWTAEPSSEEARELSRMSDTITLNSFGEVTIRMHGLYLLYMQLYHSGKEGEGSLNGRPCTFRLIRTRNDISSNLLYSSIRQDASEVRDASGDNLHPQDSKFSSTIVQLRRGDVLAVEPDLFSIRKCVLRRTHYKTFLGGLLISR